MQRDHVSRGEQRVGAVQERRGAAVPGRRGHGGSLGAAGQDALDGAVGRVPGGGCLGAGGLEPARACRRPVRGRPGRRAAGRARCRRAARRSARSRLARPPRPAGGTRMGCACGRRSSRALCGIRARLSRPGAWPGDVSDRESCCLGRDGELPGRGPGWCRHVGETLEELPPIFRSYLPLYGCSSSRSPRNPQATRHTRARRRPHRRCVVGDDRGHVRFFASATRAGRDPLVPGLLPFTEEAHAHFCRLPFAVPVRRRIGVGESGVQDTPIVGDTALRPYRFSRLDPAALAAGPAPWKSTVPGGAVAVRPRSEACVRISWPWLRVSSRSDEAGADGCGGSRHALQDPRRGASRTAAASIGRLPAQCGPL